MSTVLRQIDTLCDKGASTIIRRFQKLIALGERMMSRRRSVVAMSSLILSCPNTRSVGAAQPPEHYEWATRCLDVAGTPPFL